MHVRLFTVHILPLQSLFHLKHTWLVLIVYKKCIVGLILYTMVAYTGADKVSAEAFLKVSLPLGKYCLVFYRSMQPHLQGRSIIHLQQVPR